MKQKILFIAFLITYNSLIGQTIKRVEVHGFMYANANDVEAVAIYNRSSNKGTITNEKGEFFLEVTENDVIEISALQFETQKVTITKEVIESKSLKIYLVEHVNQLNAVILRHGLSGNLVVDIENAVIPPKIEMDLGNMNALEMYDEKGHNDFKVSRELNAVMNNHELYNGVDFVKIANMLFKPKKRSYIDDTPKFAKPKLLLDLYSRKFISDTFSIPMEHVDEFISFVENNGLSQELLNDEQEFKRIDFLVRQSELFLKQQHVKK
ncbi:carboxypeptidase-like regulatory domain-containing protein [Confluentibacter lentus]|uniref:carboxypeptidase-like regulatory domain-containing protein n=1 Tax=Confluentibacter lentus TaxID=1699412 RepID=UPI000C28357F|nr:carboxypeptidase-like regulatory domain-containing protein [Confluentibacter lentus]